jgi:hypothetical protein
VAKDISGIPVDGPVSDWIERQKVAPAGDAPNVL